MVNVVVCDERKAGIISMASKRQSRKPKMKSLFPPLSSLTFYDEFLASPGEEREERIVHPHFQARVP
jgi:hypothetical protein